MISTPQDFMLSSSSRFRLFVEISRHAAPKMQRAGTPGPGAYNSSGLGSPGRGQRHDTFQAESGNITAARNVVDNGLAEACTGDKTLARVDPRCRASIGQAGGSTQHMQALEHLRNNVSDMLCGVPSPWRGAQARAQSCRASPRPAPRYTISSSILANCADSNHGSERRGPRRRRAL